MVASARDTTTPTKRLKKAADDDGGEDNQDDRKATGRGDTADYGAGYCYHGLQS